MTRILKVGFVLVLIACVAVVLWPTSPPPPLPSTPSGQEKRGTHLALAVVYEQNGLPDKAQDEYLQALDTTVTDEINTAAWVGLQRLLANKNNVWEQIRLDARSFLASLLQTLVKVVWLLAIALLIGWLIRQVSYRSGYNLLPFNDLTGAKTGEALTQTIDTTIQKVRLIHESLRNADVIVSRGQALPGFASSTAADSIILPSLGMLAGDDALTESFAAIDAIKWGGASVPVGQLFSLARQWLDVRRYVITGSLVRIGSALHLSATLQDMRARTIVRVWEESIDAAGENQVAAPQLAQTLAYRILFDLSTNLQAPTWRSLIEFTEGLSRLQVYEAGSDDGQLLQEARVRFEKSVELAGQYWPAYFQLGLTYHRLGQHRKAAEVFNTLRLSAPYLKLEATYNLGVAHYLQFVEWTHTLAEREFEDVLTQAATDDQRPALQQLHALAHCGLAGIYAYSCNRDKTTAKHYLARAQQQTEAALKACASPFIEALTLSALGISYHGNAMYDDAIRAFQAALRLRPDDAATQVSLGVTWLAKDQPQAAAEVFQRATRLNPQSEYAHYQLGKAYHATGEDEEALASYQRAPHIANAHNERGELLAARQDFDAALDEFRQAVGLNRRLANAHANLAWWLIESGRTDTAALDEAAGHARQAIALSQGTPHEWRWRDVLGRVYLVRGLYDAAVKELLRSIEINPDAVQNQYHLAEVYHATGQALAARQLLSKVLYSDESGMWHDRAVRLMRALDNDEHT